MIDMDNYELQTTNSSIHNLNNKYKIISLLFFLIFTIISNSEMDLFMINLYLFIILIWSNIKFKIVLKNINIYIIYIIVFIFIISLLFLNLSLSIFWLIKIIDIITYILIIGISTSYYDINTGILFFLKPLKLIINPIEYSKTISKYIKIPSIIYSEKERITKTKKIKGLNISKMNFIDKIDYSLKEFITLIKFSQYKINRLNDSLYLNKYGLTIKPNYRLNKWQKTDTILLIINVLMLFIVIMY